MRTIIGSPISMRRHCRGEQPTGSPSRCSARRWHLPSRRCSCAFAKSPLKLLDAIQPSAYGIFLVHYIFIIWLQYALYDPPLPALVKFALVFAGTLALSWGLVALLRKIPFVARMI